MRWVEDQTLHSFYCEPLSSGFSRTQLVKRRKVKSPLCCAIVLFIWVIWFCYPLNSVFSVSGKTDYFPLAQPHCHIFAQAHLAGSQDTRRRGVALSQSSVLPFRPTSIWPHALPPWSRNHVDLNSTNGRHTLQSNDPSVSATAIWAIFNRPPLVDSIKHGHLLHVIAARLNGSIERRLGRGGQRAACGPLCQLAADQGSLTNPTGELPPLDRLPPAIRNTSQRLPLSLLFFFLFLHESWRLTGESLQVLSLQLISTAPVSPFICLSVFSLERRPTCDPVTSAGQLKLLCLLSSSQEPWLSGVITGKAARLNSSPWRVTYSCDALRGAALLGLSLISPIPLRGNLFFFFFCIK